MATPAIPDVAALTAISPRALELLNRLRTFVEVRPAHFDGRRTSRLISRGRGWFGLRDPAQEECIPNEKVFREQHKASADRWEVRPVPAARRARTAANHGPSPRHSPSATDAAHYGDAQAAGQGARPVEPFPPQRVP